jgi:hypothetical protein
VDDGTLSGYYRVTATRSGGTAVIRVNCSSSSPYVDLKAIQNGVLDIKHTTQITGVGTGSWTYKWFFTPESTGIEQEIGGATTSEYTIVPAGCAQRGRYRVQVTDACNNNGGADAYLYGFNYCP